MSFAILYRAALCHAMRSNAMPCCGAVLLYCTLPYLALQYETMSHTLLCSALLVFNTVIFCNIPRSRHDATTLHYTILLLTMLR